MVHYYNDGLPEPIYQSILKSIEDYDYKGDGISVTRLIDSPYIFWLNKNYTVEIPASRNLFALFGSMIHEILSRNSKYITELRLGIKVDGIELTGKCDLNDPTEKSLDDYKFIGWQSWMYEPKGKIEHQLQLNILKVIWEAHHLPIEKLNLHYIFRNLTAFDMLKHNTPDKPIITIPVDIMPDIKNYIKKRIELFKDVILYNKEPEVCSLKERWGEERYAVVKQGNTKATKVYDRELDAVSDVVQRGANYNVEPRHKDFVRCKAYCDYNSICKFYQLHKYEIKEDE